MDETRFIRLLELYRADLATDEEWQELAGMINDGPDDGPYDQRLRAVIEAVYEAEKGETGMDPARLQSILQQIYASGTTESQSEINASTCVSATNQLTVQPSGSLTSSAEDQASVVSFRSGNHRIHRARWTVAAAVLLILSTGAYFFFNRADRKEMVQQADPFPKQFDVVPGGQRATLTLSDGSTILLDSVQDGLLARQGGTAVKKLKDGKIVYQTAGAGTAKTLYNTMATPRGGQYQLRLPDGTGVWLNASSSITYPTEFAGNRREVNMTGEAYFEVSLDKTKPFIVRTAREEISVLGTSFNVNSYADEPASKTTLLEGAVRINDKLLKPGQAYLNGKAWPQGKIVTTDVSQDIAWKNGMFDFQDKKLEEVMRQLSRWYDMEIVYEKGVPDLEFGGEMGRDLNLSQVLKGLQSSEVHFRLEGNKKLIVKP